MLLFTTKPYASPFANTELSGIGINTEPISPGLLSIKNMDSVLEKQFCFLSWQIINPTELQPDQNQRGVEKVDAWFRESIINEKIVDPWPMVWLVKSENGYMQDRAMAERLAGLMKKRISRIVSLAQYEDFEIGVKIRGLVVVPVDDGRIFVSREMVYYGQRRMKDDPQAPSRSYLKMEEALAIFGRAPKGGESVADLGAAPGGWSWSAAKRGAQVFAVDNGPLKKGAMNHHDIKHIKADAYTWDPPRQVDWLFCDMVDQPQQVLGLIRKWFERKWCRYAIVNFKYGRVNPMEILKFIHGNHGIAPLCKRLLCRHLFHDRDEITVMAEI
jgi:23S rRNA (cytidine2498-2'-O)-methyltransferase